jgi:GTP-binding protein LepA
VRLYELNLIDTPGHVDFTYEVSRSLAACEGAILVVDASQGIQAQTLSNLFLALDAGLEIIPVLNKIDLPGAEPERRKQEVHDLIGADPDRILLVSAKEGHGVSELLEEIVARVPPPTGDPDGPLRALIFDSYYDRYRGAVPTSASSTDRSSEAWRSRSARTKRSTRSATSGTCSCDRCRRTHSDRAKSATWLRTCAAWQRRVRATRSSTQAIEPRRAARYQDVHSMVFAGMYPSDTSAYEQLRDALAKLRLNDASLQYEPETSTALGFGFRCGFLGLLHMEIVQERLEREFDLDLVTTVPNVEYHVYEEDGTMVLIENPSKMPAPGTYNRVEEPYVKARIMAPSDYIGPIMTLGNERRGIYKNMTYLDQARVEFDWEFPLAESFSTSSTVSRRSAAGTRRWTTRCSPIGQAIS